MVRGHYQKQEENFKSKFSISSTRRRMADCPCMCTSSHAALVVPALCSQDRNVKLFFVPDTRHPSRWAHLSSTFRDSCSAAARSVWLRKHSHSLLHWFH